jgi:hypothetical protein
MSYSNAIPVLSSRSPSEHDLPLPKAKRGSVPKVKRGASLAKSSHSMLTRAQRSSMTAQPQDLVRLQSPRSRGEVNRLNQNGAHGSTQLAGCMDDSEDSIYRKLLACIPVIGIIPTVFNELSLEARISKDRNPARLVKFITVKNHYAIASIIREVLSIALLIAGVAYNVLKGDIRMAITAATGIIAGSSIAYNAYAIYKNSQRISELEAQIPPVTH